MASNIYSLSRTFLLGLVVMLRGMGSSVGSPFLSFSLSPSPMLGYLGPMCSGAS